MWIFENTLNTRPILPNSIKYIRSDVPVKVSETEKESLLENGVTTVIDLRGEAEREKKPCALMGDERFDYRCFEVSGGKAPKSPEEVPSSYLAMVNEDFEGLMGFLMALEGGAIYFCNAGKDRTGVVTAVLLHRLGMNAEYITEDYMKSAENLKGFLSEYAATHPGTDLDVITPKAWYMEDFLRLYESERR